MSELFEGLKESLQDIIDSPEGDPIETPASLDGEPSAEPVQKVDETVLPASTVVASEKTYPADLKESTGHDRKVDVRVHTSHIKNPA